MERINLPLAQFSFAQKLGILEDVWDDLATNEELLNSPAWHEDILADRKTAFTAGKISVSDWEEAKNRIKKNISCK
ncbi:MAG: addiction module protein [Thermodesulfobacteriota bacterium]|nr:addiction module protein [Thermodesulfobacteriota bacterium]